MLGPVIQAQVGDTMKVLFRNGCRFRASGLLFHCLVNGHIRVGMLTRYRS